MDAYWSDTDAGLALYLGDMREILPALGVTADLIVADPPYGETAHAWDSWPDGWLDVAAAHSHSMWCFGSMRMFFRRHTEFEAAGWKLSQDIVGRDEDDTPVYGDVNVVWEKNTGSGRVTDRFRRVHEHVLHWYQGPWGDTHHEVPRVEPLPDPETGRIRRDRFVKRAADDIAHAGAYRPRSWSDDGTRLMRSVIGAKNLRGKGAHATQKPVPLLDPLIRYGCPPGGVVVDPFGGSCSTLHTARQLGLRAVAIEAHEPHAEAAALRLSALTLPIA